MLIERCHETPKNPSHHLSTHQLSTQHKTVNPEILKKNHNFDNSIAFKRSKESLQFTVMIRNSNLDPHLNEI